MKKCLSTQIADIMDQVDKCKVLIELLEHKNSDNDWQLGQTPAVMKGMLTPAISQPVEISDDLWEEEQQWKQQHPDIAPKQPEQTKAA